MLNSIWRFLLYWTLFWALWVHVLYASESNERTSSKKAWSWDSAGSFSLSLTPHGPWVQIHNNHLTRPWKSKATARFTNPLLTGWFQITQFPAHNLLSVPTESPAQRIYSLNKGKQLFLFFSLTLACFCFFLSRSALTIYAFIWPIEWIWNIKSTYKGCLR